MTEVAGDQHRIQAVDRAAALLRAIARSEAPLTAMELARECGVNRTTAWRLLRTLEHHGLVERDVHSQRYALGYGLAALASAAGDEALIRRARPLLTDLAARTGEAVSLAVIKRFQLIPVEQIEPTDVARPSWLGKELPLHATSGGKVFLAWLRPDERKAALAPRLRRFTEQTITDCDQLRKDLDKVRSRGYAVSVREYEAFTSGVSAPVLNARQVPLGVVTIWGFGPRTPAGRLHELGRQAARTASLIQDVQT
jgi:DNA-binding IclR family transcriptional regulator